MSAPDLDAIRARIRGSVIWIFHPTVNPCACGECNPTAHPNHPRHEDLRALRADIDALLAEVERVQVEVALWKYRAERLPGVNRRAIRANGGPKDE